MKTYSVWKSRRWHSEEVRRPQIVAVVGEEGMPTLRRWPSQRLPSVSSNGGGTQVVSECQEFAADAHRAPAWIFAHDVGQ